MNSKISTITIVGIALTLHAWLYGFAPPPTHSTDAIDFLQHNVWTIEDGLPLDTVNKITQTHDGYLWLGTEAGAARFDGLNFRVFNHEDTPAFSSDIVSSLMVDRNGTLWIGTRVGGIIRYKNGIIDTITQDSGLLDNDIWDIMESLDDSVWIGTGTGLNRIVNGKITVVSLAGIKPDSRFQPVSCLLEDRNGCIWVGTITSGLFRVEKRGSTFESEFVGPGRMHLTTLLEDRKGNIWIGTAEKGLFKYLEDKYISFTTKDGLSTNNIRCLYEDRWGNLWIGTEGGGINILAPGDNRISIYRSQEEFTSGGIVCFFEDREGTLWIGTDGRGLNSLRKTKITTYSMKNGLSYHNVYGVFQDSKDRIWVGSKGYGVNYFRGNRFQALTTNNGLSSNNVVSIAEDPSGSLWFGTLGGGVNRYRNDRFQAFTTSHGLSSNFVRALYVDPAGHVLVGTISGGIHQFQDGRFTLLADVKSRVNVLFKDSNEYLWAGTLGRGLCRLKNGKIDVFNTRNGLSHNIICSIHEDRERTLWVGTFKGLNRLGNKKISVLLKKDGLPDDVIYCILEDHKRDFWISSNRGIYCLRRQDIDDFFSGRVTKVAPVVYGREAGMRSVECNGGNQPAGWKSRDGKLWFPTTNGISVIDPKNIGMNKLPPPVVIEKFISDGVSYSTDKIIQVAPGKNNLEIHYSALSFIIPKKILFKYKMEGYDNQWTDAGTNRTAFYAGLPPGKYRFHVTACNSDGVWNEAGTWVELRMKPKFYQTLPFKIFLLLIAAFFTGFLLFYLKNTVKQILKHRAASRNSMLNLEKSKEYIQKLLYLMEVEKIYRDPNLTMKSLASKLIINSRTLSQVINDHLNTNFYEFVNEYRIKEAQKILMDAASKHKSILDISYDVGYNSKSAFNRAFKNFTRVTPSEFRRKCTH